LNLFGAASSKTLVDSSKFKANRGLIQVLNCWGDSSLEKEFVTNSQNDSRAEFVFIDEFIRVLVITGGL